MNENGTFRYVTGITLIDDMGLEFETVWPDSEKLERSVKLLDWRTRMNLSYQAVRTQLILPPSPWYPGVNLT